MFDNDFFQINKFNFHLFLGPVLTGIFIFLIFLFLLVPLRINIPITIVISVVIFGLTKYYFSKNYNANKDFSDKASVIDGNENQVKDEKNPLDLLFVITYTIFLAITFFTSYNSNIFVPWSQLTTSETITLVSSIGLSFFIPGYAIINLISKDKELGTILKSFFAYFISVLLTGLCGYITAEIGFAVLDNKNAILGINSVILIVYFVLNSKKIFNNNILNFNYHRTVTQTIFSLRKNNPLLLVFLSLLLIEILSTYYLFNGTIIGDQWFHHGRSLSFITGAAFKDIESGVWRYPPLLSSLLSEFFVLSGIPSVNAYVSLNFLNIIPVLIFYFFIRKWLPGRMKKAALLATTLFMLSSGYGWGHIVQLSSHESISSQTSVLEIFRVASLKTMDINAPNNFLNTPHPWALSNLIIIALPAGFLLLGLLKVRISSKLKYFFLIVIVSTVGIISHDEFYLFILVASVLPLIYQLNKTHIIFMSLSSSIFLVFVMDVLLPVKFFTIRTILDIPLIALCFGFVLTMWVFYTSRILHILGNIPIPKINGALFYNKRIQFVIATIIASIVLYLYFFTFIVWDHLSVDEVSLQTDNYGNRDIPWYLFPIKFGIVGLLGLLFVLSYMYKKFEREIFVFAIITIFAFLLGPYYDEHRFGKYIMVGMIGFASLLIYRIICYFQTLKMNVLIGGIFLGLVITSSGLSLLMLIGFTDLLLVNPEYRLIPGENNRFFPTESEMKFLTVLKNKIINLKTDNIALLDKDYGNGLLSEKLMGFVGVPFQRIYHNPLILNATSLTALYQFLDTEDIRYIVIEGEDLKNTTKYTNPVKFAVENFPRVYQDNDYLVLKVPQLIGPNQNPDIAVINEPGDQLPSSPIYTNLQYNTSSFDLNATGHVKIEKSGSLILSNNETNPTTVRSIVDNKKINFIETEFKIIQENKPKNRTEINWKNDTSLFQQVASDQYPNNNLGIRWNDNQSQYSLLLTTKGLQLSSKRINGTYESSVMKNQEILKEPLKWYNIKVLLLDKEIIIFVNDLPKMQIAREAGDQTNSPISKIEVVAHGNNVEFLPIKVKQVTDLENLYNTNLKNIYYVISLLAMSKVSYGVFLMPDLSVTTKSIILAVDPTSMSADSFNRYLEYVRMGGTVIVLDSRNSVNGVFGKFLSFNSTNTFSEFSKISYSYNNYQDNINVTGKTRVITMPLKNDLKAVSFYNDKLNKKISPFTIVKEFPNGGKIIYVNNAGFFDSISNGKSNFLTLANFTKLLNLKPDGDTFLTRSDKSNLTDQFTDIEKFIGLMELNGQINIKSDVLLPYSDENRSENLNLHVNKLVLSNNTKKINFDNVIIRQLRFYGQYTAEINYSGFMSMPSSNSFYDYIDFHMPMESSINIKIDPRVSGGAEISLVDKSKASSFNFNDDFEIDIQKGNSKSTNDSLDFLVKNPELKFTGKAIVDSPKFYDIPLSGSRFLKINGTISTQFDHVDDYREKSDRSLETRYITYLNGMKITGKTNPYAENIKIMGDVSYRARNHDVNVPLLQNFTSTQNIILLISAFIICFFLSRLMWSRKLIFRS